MSPSTALRPHAGEAARWQLLLNHDLLAIVAAGLVAVLLTQWLVDAPTRVPLTVVNTTDYELTIDAAGPSDTQWLPVVVIDPHQTQDRFGTIDRGSDWVFRFSAQGRSGGEVAITRTALEASDWRFEIPPEVVEALEAAGATPPPRTG